MILKCKIIVTAICSKHKAKCSSSQCCLGKEIIVATKKQTKRKAWEEWLVKEMLWEKT